MARMRRPRNYPHNRDDFDVARGGTSGVPGRLGSTAKDRPASPAKLALTDPSRAVADRTRWLVAFSEVGRQRDRSAWARSPNAALVARRARAKNQMRVG